MDDAPCLGLRHRAPRSLAPRWRQHSTPARLLCPWLAKVVAGSASSSAAETGLARRVERVCAGSGAPNVRHCESLVHCPRGGCRGGPGRAVNMLLGTNFARLADWQAACRVSPQMAASAAGTNNVIVCDNGTGVRCRGTGWWRREGQDAAARALHLALRAARALAAASLASCGEGRKSAALVPARLTRSPSLECSL